MLPAPPLPTPPAVTPISATLTGEDTWSALRARPIWLPAYGTNTTCPVTQSELAPEYGRVFGAGPVHTIPFLPGVDLDDGRAPWSYALGGQAVGGTSSRPGTWYYMKVLWIARPDYRGPALIRGRQLDGPHELRFDEGADPPRELLFPLEGTALGPGAAAGWRDRPSYARVQAPGCYAFQIDGLDFTSMVVFRAAP